MKTGIGVREAFVALKARDVNPAAFARIENTVNSYEDLVTLCRTNSFPADTGVLMADGSRKAISDVRVDEAVLVTDPETGQSAAQHVTDTFHHDTTRLMDITVGGGLLTSTAGHRFHVEAQGWTLVSDLRVGNSLRTPDGTLHRCTIFRTGLVWRPARCSTSRSTGSTRSTDGTGGDRPQDVLVHNCTSIVGDEGIEGAHTLGQHVTPNDARMAEMAVEKGTSTKRTDQATAAAAVDQAMANWIKLSGNAKKLESWRIKQAQRVGKGISFDPRKDMLTIRVPVTGLGSSLGRKWVKDGPQGVAVGNVVHSQLKFAKGHAKPRTWVVYTAYPE